MTQELKTLFQEINFDDIDADFNGAIITKVQYFHQTQAAVINIKLSNFLKVTTLKKFEQQLAKLSLIKLNIYFIVDNNFIDEMLILSYFEYIKTHKLQLVAGIYHTLSSNNITYQNHSITISVNNSIEENLIKKEFAHFACFFQQYGFLNLILKTKINKTPSSLISYDNETKNEIIKLTSNLKVASSPNNSAPKTTTYNTYRKKVKVDLLKTPVSHVLKDIIGDETNIIVSGKVFKVNKFLTKTQK